MQDRMGKHPRTFLFVRPITDRKDQSVTPIGKADHDFVLYDVAMELVTNTNKDRFSVEIGQRECHQI